MKVFAGIVKINQTHISFQHQPSHEVQHLSLLKNRQTKYDHLVERWPLLNIECYQLKKFLLRLNSLEIFFRDRTSIFLCFGKKSDGEQSLNRFIELLGKFRKI